MKNQFTASIRWSCLALLSILFHNLQAQQYPPMEMTRTDSLVYSSPELLGIDSALLYQGIDSIVSLAMDSGAFPGCQILLAQKGRIFYEQAFGYHTYDSLRPVLMSDLYDLASVTKIVAGTNALMKLYDEGLVDLDQTLGYYFPYLKGSNKESLTLRKVLAHQSRLKSWIPYYKESRRHSGKYKWKTFKSDSSARYPIRVPGSDLYMYRDYYDKKVKRLIRKSALYEEEAYVYSGLSFYLIPELVERLTGLPFDQYLNEIFYDPLGANSLGFEPMDRYPLDEIVPTEIDSFFRMKPLHGVVHDEGAAVMQGVSGNAGLFSNSYDLAKVLQMWLNGGQYAGVRYLSDSTIEEFTRCQYCDLDNRRGLGFDKPLITYDEEKSSVAKAASPASYGHTGYTGTLVWADPVNGLMFIFLSNRVYPTRENKKIYEMNVRPAIHNLVYELLNKERA